MKSCVAALFLAAVAPVLAEEVSDPAQFRAPAVFVTPKPPVEALKQADEVAYSATVEIDSFGRVASLTKLEPDHDEFRALLVDAMRFWVFYPMVDRETCTAMKGEALVEMRYRRDSEEPRVWVYTDPLGHLLNVRPPRPLNRPGLPPYPRAEARKGLQGEVFVVLTIGSSGAVEDSRLLLGLPPSPGFVDAAITGSKELRFDPGTAPRRCTIQRYSFRLQ